jgi:replicative DNA helicase
VAEVIPQAAEAEESVLGACLYSQAALDVALDRLKPEYFFRESHSIIFQAMVDMGDGGIPTDSVTVKSYLAEKGLLDSAGGPVRLEELIALAPATANVGHYAKLVRDAWRKRLVLRHATEIANNIETMSADDAVAALDSAALTVEAQTEERHELVVDIKELVTSKRYFMEHPQAEVVGVPSPFSFITNLVGGRLYVLSGYMKDGKTASFLQFAAAAAEAGDSVGIVSAEMSKTDLFDRWACQRTGLDYWKIKNPWLLDMQEREILEQALAEMESWPVDVIDDESVNPAKLRRYQRAGKYSLLGVDHLHRFRWKDRHDLENQVKSITNVAREFEVPLILLAQLSRAGDYAKPFPVPSMRQLRETAMLEAEASAVWFVYRERDDNHVQTSRAQFIVAANRYGKADSYPLYFDDKSQTFREMEWEAVEVEAPKSGGMVAF